MIDVKSGPEEEKILLGCTQSHAWEQIQKCSFFVANSSESEVTSSKLSLSVLQISPFSVLQQGRAKLQLTSCWPCISRGMVRSAHLWGSSWSCRPCSLTSWAATKEAKKNTVWRISDAPGRAQAQKAWEGTSLKNSVFCGDLSSCSPRGRTTWPAGLGRAPKVSPIFQACSFLGAL